MDQIEFGKLLAQMEYLRDAVKTVQTDITTALISRKDMERTLSEISKALDLMDEREDKIDKKLAEYNAKLNDHISKDIGLGDALHIKVGKWVIGVVLAVLTAWALQALNIFKGLVIKP